VLAPYVAVGGGFGVARCDPLDDPAFACHRVRLAGLSALP
jgi:hypothetical protein